MNEKLLKLVKVVGTAWIVSRCSTLVAADEETCETDGADAGARSSRAAVVQDSLSEPSAPRRPCGCAGKVPHLQGILKCAVDSTMQDQESMTQQPRVLIVTHVIQEAALWARYTLPLTALHIAPFGHGLQIEKWPFDSQVKPREGSAQYRSEQVRGLLKVLQAHNHERSSPWQWLFWLDPDAAVISEKDLLRQLLRSLTPETHVMLSKHGQSGQEPVSGAILLRKSKWTEGFLLAWLQELSVAGFGDDEADRALSRAAQRAQKLGGADAVRYLKPGALSSNLLDRLQSKGSDDNNEHGQIPHLRNQADEVRDQFWHKVWDWACKRPSGLLGGTPSALERLHEEALEATASALLGVHTMRKIEQLHRMGQEVPKAAQPEVLWATLSGYASIRAKSKAVEPKRALRLAQLCAAGYDLVESATDREDDIFNSTAAQDCLTALEQLSSDSLAQRG
eukprot:TRINITY_DN94965_c0_g1_i1.p1 TRINITY_DN94965_c0_g1~~TRINITY_DN94965_c0_g1_i1.p1  ORF type:complete len:451 (-),score=78.17 TRINITY_DN94965_c0_g1_i1:88-1440(-)